MAIPNISQTGGAAFQPLSVDDFRREAAIGESVQVQVDGAEFKLVAMGKTPSGRSVAWVEGCGDTTKVFVEALEGAYGGRLSKAVAAELGLQPTPGQSLSSRTVREALDMAETANVALSGVRYGQQLQQPDRGGNPGQPLAAPKDRT